MQNIQVKQMPAYDVIVVGGGIAGVAAAVAAARGGAKTLLMEKTVTLGGLATQGLISWYEPLCDGEGKQMIHGIAEELIRLSVKYGFEDMPLAWGGKSVPRANYTRYATHYSPHIFALALIRYLEDNGVALRFDTLATYPDVEDGICRGILVETISGREYFPAKMVIDATGDATVCERAGIPTEYGDNFFTYITHELNADDAQKLAESGNFCPARRWRWTGSDLFGNGNNDNKHLQARTADDVTAYMVRGGRMVLNRLEQEDRFSREILSIPTMPQYRKIRRIIGESEFNGTEHDLHIDNAVGAMGDFRKPGRRFELPYTTLYNKAVRNLFAAGRIISAKGDGWEITRVIPVAALSGEVVGTAAALCVKHACDNDTLDVALLQKALVDAGNRISL